MVSNADCQQLHREERNDNNKKKEQNKNKNKSHKATFY
jgi:hypothetical protein